MVFIGTNSNHWSVFVDSYANANVCKIPLGTISLAILPVIRRVPLFVLLTTPNSCHRLSGLLLVNPKSPNAVTQAWHSCGGAVILAAYRSIVPSIVPMRRHDLSILDPILPITHCIPLSSPPLLSSSSFHSSKSSKLGNEK
jgi:hypothetical protein